MSHPSSQASSAGYRQGSYGTMTIRSREMPSDQQPDEQTTSNALLILESGIRVLRECHMQSRLEPTASLASCLQTSGDVSSVAEISKSPQPPAYRTAYSASPPVPPANRPYPPWVPAYKVPSCQRELACILRLLEGAIRSTSTRLMTVHTCWDMYFSSFLLRSFRRIINHHTYSIISSNTLSLAQTASPPSPPAPPTNRHYPPQPPVYRAAHSESFQNNNLLV